MWSNSNLHTVAFEGSIVDFTCDCCQLVYSHANSQLNFHESDKDDSSGSEGNFLFSSTSRQRQGRRESHPRCFDYFHFFSHFSVPRLHSLSLADIDSHSTNNIQTFRISLERSLRVLLTSFFLCVRRRREFESRRI